jgi:hypothetical protein
MGADRRCRDGGPGVIECLRHGPGADAWQLSRMLAAFDQNGGDRLAAYLANAACRHAVDRLGVRLANEWGSR